MIKFISALVLLALAFLIDAPSEGPLSVVTLLAVILSLGSLGAEARRF
jgi:hypothetical protein